MVVDVKVVLDAGVVVSVVVVVGVVVVIDVWVVALVVFLFDAEIDFEVNSYFNINCVIMHEAFASKIFELPSHFSS